MESQFSPDKEIPPVPLKTYQWEDLRRAREAGAYPWTHLLKPPLQGEVTAEDVLRESTPRRSMSRDVSRSLSRSRTRSPAERERDDQRILHLDSSPGSSRRHGEEGEDEGPHIPNFSKEISLDSEDDAIKQAEQMSKPLDHQSSSHLATPLQVPKNASPKSILKRRGNETQYIGITESREKTKCCHPLVNKIKHLADKTLHKLERNDNEKSPQSKRKKNTTTDQEIRQLKTSPGTARRQKFSAIKLGDSDEMSKTMSVDLPPSPRERKEHIYEDIEEAKAQGEKALHFSPDIEHQIAGKKDQDNASHKENDSILEKKSNASQDPSLVADETNGLKPEEHVMEKLHRVDDINKEAVILDDELDADEPNVDEIFLNQLEETRHKDIQKESSPNITITEIEDDSAVQGIEQTSEYRIESSPSPQAFAADMQTTAADDSRDWSKISRAKVMSTLRRWTSEGGKPVERPLRPTREGSVQSYTPDVRCACQFFQSDSLLPERVNPVGTRPTSRASNFISNVSDHEYEIIEKPPPNVLYTAPSVEERTTMVKTDDELSSTTSLERKCLQIADEDEQMEDKERYLEEKDDDIARAEALQKNIEDRYFVNTPSTVSRTECEVSTSQVDSSALENLPLKRESRQKNAESLDHKIQQRIKEGTGKLKTQAGKLKTKLQNIKASMPDKPKINLPDRPKFKMPEKFNLPDRPKFTLPDRRKFSLPDRPKFKKINISEKLSLGDRKKFTLPDRPKFNVPDMPKFKLPERPKINFPSLGRKKEYRIDTVSAESSSDVRHVATVDYETKTYPRLFNRKKKTVQRVSSSPTLEREDTPPPVFTFTRVKKTTVTTGPRAGSPAQQPREYGSVDDNEDFEGPLRGTKSFDETYDFDKAIDEYVENEVEPSNDHDQDTASIQENSPSKQEFSHINEIDNDEFFVRPRGISRENIQVREYLSDEIRQAFKIPKNALAMMGGTSREPDEHTYINDVEADPDLCEDNEPPRYSNEDVNDKDDGYYTFPPVRPSRAKRKKKELDGVQYIDESVTASQQFSEVDLEYPVEDRQQVEDEVQQNDYTNDELFLEMNGNGPHQPIQHEYTNEPMYEYSENMPIQSQTLPMPPRRKKKSLKSDDYMHSSLNDFREMPPEECQWREREEPNEGMIVYRTEHEYVIPQTETVLTEGSPQAPRRTRSRSSRGTSLCDDDRTSHGAESLTLDTHHQPDDELDRHPRRESPGYATVDKTTAKTARRSTSRTPPPRSRKSHSSERKYYTVGRERDPDRPPRKKSSTSLVTLESITKRSPSADITQYVEINQPRFEEAHKDLVSGEVISKMKDRPLPPPPRPPRGSKRVKREKRDPGWKISTESQLASDSASVPDEARREEVVEIEVSTQTDPLPDDVDYELGIDENIDISMSSSLKDIIDENSITKSYSKLAESPRVSRPTSRSEKSFKLSDPKISELSKSTIGRTSPTVILVERRVSSPTRINEREEMLTEASLTVQHIDVADAQVPELPPLPAPRAGSRAPSAPSVPSAPAPSAQSTPSHACDERALEKVSDTNREVQLDNLVTQRLQVRDLDVGRLNVSELQASKILVSDIEGMTLQVTELDSKSGHISVSGIEFSQTVIDEIVKKFAEISTSTAAASQQHESMVEHVRPLSRSEETQTELGPAEAVAEEGPPRPASAEDSAPQRPPPPDLTPLLYSYLQELSLPAGASVYRAHVPRDRPFTEFHEAQLQPPPPQRRAKRKPAATVPPSESSSDGSRAPPSPRRAPPPPARGPEPSIAEAGAQFFRVCHTSISRALRGMFHSFMSYISGTEDKRDVQMALVIFLVLIAGLIMFGLSDSRTIHHHHWEFFNPPEGKPT